jgi:hypothetical protein
MRRFEETYDGWQNGRLTQEEAALLLGVCSRTFRRYIYRYEADGMEGLMDRRIAQACHGEIRGGKRVRIIDTTASEPLVGHKHARLSDITRPP